MFKARCLPYTVSIWQRLFISALRWSPLIGGERCIIMHEILHTRCTSLFVSKGRRKVHRKRALWSTTLDTPDERATPELAWQVFGHIVHMLRYIGRGTGKYERGVLWWNGDVRSGCRCGYFVWTGRRWDEMGKIAGWLAFFPWLHPRLVSGNCPGQSGYLPPRSGRPLYCAYAATAWLRK